MYTYTHAYITTACCEATYDKEFIAKENNIRSCSKITHKCYRYDIIRTAIPDPQLNVQCITNSSQLSNEGTLKGQCDAFVKRPCAPGFFGSCIGMCVCLSVCPPKGIINQWRDIGCVRLLKQVPWLIPYFIWHLPSIKWIGMTILTQHVVNAYQRKLR